MYNGKVIKSLLNAQGKKAKDLLVHMGMNDNAPITPLINGNPSASRLERIADFFEVPIDMFFVRGAEVSGTQKESRLVDAKYIDELLAIKDQQLTEKDMEIARLREELQKKNKVIELQKEQIATLS